ncbi:MAG: type 2 isopentenyl-diphosphate Delta-isomerase [Candidatus Thermoplasmatota archaeon]|nr:type 2 isopentenyl-diphosphate Delta-isomerase [Candidatus Thermoplasmatota archaeon]
MSEDKGRPARLTERRKGDHVDICATEDLAQDYVYWDDIKLVHNPLPEIDLEEIDTSTTMFGRKLGAPLVISAMTGGYGKAEEINRNLAAAAEKFGVGMGVGSQRAALENQEVARTYSVIREYEVPLRIGNLGVPQLIPQGEVAPLDVEHGRAAMEMVDAHILAVHMNYLQEIVQPEGDTRSRGGLKALERFASALPVLAKETGAGIPREAALKLKKAKVKGLDVGGLGGTSFAAVEYYRAKSVGDSAKANIGRTFWDWGIPTPVAVVIANVGLPVIATGGVRSGLDAARAISIGASSAGMAGRLLPAALEGRDSLEKELQMLIDELKATMFLVGAKDVDELASSKAIVTGRSKEWLDQLEE